jgi:hypothetical protein
MKLLSLTELSRLIGLSDKTLRLYRDRIPGAVVVGKRTLYREEAVLRFIEQGGSLASPNIHAAA